MDISLKFRQLLPEPCLLCGTLSPTNAWCDACDASLPRLNTPSCPLCALPTHAGEICGRCLKHPPHFDHTVAAFSYAFPLNKLVQALKYGEQLALANRLADALAECLQTRPECLIAMPLHANRLHARGFNQSTELARRIANRLDIPLLHDACHRVRDTEPQSALAWKKRGRNMRRAFECPRELSGHVAIVDDVMTTGASLNAAALALKKAGAREVSAWVVARTLPNAPWQWKRPA